MYTYPNFDKTKYKKMQVIFDYTNPTIHFEFVDDVYQIPLEQVEVYSIK